MSRVVAIMSMSLDGYVADRNDGVGEVFDWYMNSGDVEFHTGGSAPMTFKVSGPSELCLGETFTRAAFGQISFAPSGSRGKGVRWPG
jgi:hypothetical protein